MGRRLPNFPTPLSFNAPARVNPFEFLEEPYESQEQSP